MDTDDVLALVGRLFVAIIFLASAFGKITNFDGAMQFMEAHGLNKDGDYTYHHCADIKITVDPAKPVDKAWPGQS